MILGHERARGRQDDHQLKSSPNEIFGTTPVQRNRNHWLVLSKMVDPLIFQS
jgi:hypothetical protein